MAQLIKLQDYISRYEWDAYRYPSQYIRLKQENWKNLYQMWKDAENEEEEQQEPDTEPRGAESFFSKWMRFGKNEEEADQETSDPREDRPTSETELKQYYLDKLLSFQLKWATSTVTDTSFMNRDYYSDPLLKYFLQRFPDTYLLLFYPIFNINQAPVEGEVILISPIGIEIIYVLEGQAEPGAVFYADSERTWSVQRQAEQTTMLSPLIPLKRTEKLVKSMLTKQQVDFPVQKTVLSRTNPIVSSQAAYQTTIAGKDDYPEWFQKKRALASPLKAKQLKAAETILNYCQTTSVKRPEWEEDNDFFPVGKGD